MTDPQKVHEILKRHQLADGLPMVFDLDRSRGAWLHDARTGEDYLDFFTCFASWPIGYNHPAFCDAQFLADMQRASLNNPSNSDLYTTLMADFVEAFATRVTPPEYPHHFWVSGGALAVENAIKAAFDWKARKIGVDKITDDGASLVVLHFKAAFHGRSGYTMSLTNTLPVKTALYPKFAWPRVHNPAIEFDLDGEIANDIEAEEARSVREIEAAFGQYKGKIAAILIEPMQGEGGDNHFRPEFLKKLRQFADENEALLIFDEVQTGFFGSGKPWMWQHHGVAPDIVAFGKKTQVCGIYANRRVDEVKDNVFHTAEPHQLDLGRQPDRHGALPQVHRDHPGRAFAGEHRAHGSAVHRRLARARARSRPDLECPRRRLARRVHAEDARDPQRDAEGSAREADARPGVGREGDPVSIAADRRPGRGRYGARPHRSLPAGARSGLKAQILDKSRCAMSVRDASGRASGLDRGFDSRTSTRVVRTDANGPSLA